MSTTQNVTPLRVASAPLILPRLARAHADALGTDARAVRLAILGTAGSGKSRLLHHLVTQLTAQGRTVIESTRARDTTGVPAEHVLVVDDAHLADVGLADDLARRLADPTASLVIALRPWPSSSPIDAVRGELERSQPAVVLGHIAGGDVVQHLDEAGRLIDKRCLDAVLEMTGHLTWLASEALAVHDDLACDGGGHPEITEAMGELIAHRLDTLDPAARAAVIAASLGSSPADGAEGAVTAGYATGLLLRNGRPAPIVRDTVHAVVPVDALVEHYATTLGLVPAAQVRALVAGVRDARLAAALLRDGDGALARDPRRAADLYASAGDAGAAAAQVAQRRAEASWAMGEIDAASALVDELVVTEQTMDAAATELAAAVWAARGHMRLSAATFAASAGDSPRTVAHATVAAVGAADADALGRLATAPAAHTIPSAITVSLSLVSDGLRASLIGDSPHALGQLVRASEMYSASGCCGPIPELPAVLAALAAIHLGDLAAAETILDDAERAGHGGLWARPRLQVWRAWVAIQREHPAEAEARLRDAAASSAPMSMRDRLVVEAVQVALARRHGDAATLAVAWARAREMLLRTSFDLYSLVLLGEFTVAAARLGDFDRVRPHLDDAFALLDRLGNPPRWSPPLHWSALHAAILRGDPAALAPHARALLAAADHSGLAASMAHAGRVWTGALAGEIDADVVERASLSLAEVGLAWDGARLASFAADRVDDRRVSGRLLAVARQLLTRDRAPVTEVRAPEADRPRTSDVGDVLTSREREVARLVLQGKTYAEIGASIFISPRTAEHHIARIRRRLGATSRSDLMSKLRVVIHEALDSGERLSSTA